ncbi:MAG: hypothetical protein MUP81_06325 [Dehalococcoidia bacterium]|nr:hypothetical protein [Dehalococcoidia bacterium]
MEQTVKQLSLDDIIIPKSKTFDPEKKICHGAPMRKVELSPGRFAYRCDECQTLMVREK